MRNSLAQIKQRTFLTLTKLGVLNLSYNKITKFDEDMLPLAHDQLNFNIDIDHNPVSNIFSKHDSIDISKLLRESKVTARNVKNELKKSNQLIVVQMASE